MQSVGAAAAPRPARHPGNGSLISFALIPANVASNLLIRQGNFWEGNLMSLILIILILILVFGGGGGYYAHRSYGGRGSGGVLGLILIVLLVVWLVGGFGPGYMH